MKVWVLTRTYEGAGCTGVFDNEELAFGTVRLAYPSPTLEIRIVRGRGRHIVHVHMKDKESFRVDRFEVKEMEVSMLPINID